MYTFLTGCSDGPAAFPGSLGDGISVEKPLNFRASAFQRNVTEGGHLYRASGVQFEWKGPVSGEYINTYISCNVIDTSVVLLLLYS